MRSDVVELENDLEDVLTKILTLRDDNGHMLELNTDNFRNEMLWIMDEIYRQIK